MPSDQPYASGPDDDETFTEHRFPFTLIKQDMDRSIDGLRAALTDALYQASLRPYRPVCIAWHHRAWRSVRWYLGNLWEALCGRAPEYDDFD